jgi:DNA-binding NarL/FixJ family response regulator
MSHPDPLGVLLIDDSASLRELTRVLLEEDKRLTISGEADAISKALELLERVEVGAIVLDHSLPEMAGMDAIPLLREKAPEAAILLYTGHVFPGMEEEAVSRGAQGVIEKGSSIAEMAETIYSAAAARARSHGGESGQSADSP